jgi:hypothetical protein
MIPYQTLANACTASSRRGVFVDAPDHLAIGEDVIVLVLLLAGGAGGGGALRISVIHSPPHVVQFI